MTATIHTLPRITPRRAARYAQLLETSRDPRDMRIRCEYLVQAANAPRQAEVIKLDASTDTLSCRVLTPDERVSVGIPVDEAHPAPVATDKPQGSAFLAFTVIMLLLIAGLFGWAISNDTQARAAETVAQGEARRAM